MSFRFILLCLLTLLPGLGAAYAAGTTTVVVSGPSPYAYCTAGGVSGRPPTTINYLNAEVEPYLAVDPRTTASGHRAMIGAWQQDRWSDGASRGLVAGSSTDGGNTWTETPLPFDQCASPESEYVRASDPWVSIGPDGVAYAVGLALRNSASAVLATTSTDGGRTWAHLRAIIQDPEGASFNDKESVTADPYRSGTAYVVWDRGLPNDDEPTGTYFSRTRDGGRTWSLPQRIIFQARKGSETIGNQIVVLPHPHRIFDIYTEIYRRSAPETCVTSNGKKTCVPDVKGHKNPVYDYYVDITRSTNGGTTWTKPSRIVREESVGVPLDWGGPVRGGEILPQAAVDPARRRLYVVWQDARASGLHYDEVELTSSDDEGAHWRVPKRISRPAGKPSFTPSIAVNARGVVGVTYYQATTTVTPGSPAPVAYWFIASADGVHYKHPVRIAGPFDVRTAPQAGGYFLGDYQGLAAAGDSFEALFARTNGDANNRTDIVAVRVAAPF